MTLFPHDVSTYCNLLASVIRYSDLSREEILHLRVELAKKDEEIDALKHIVLESWKRKKTA